MIKRQQEEAEQRRQIEINEVNLLHKFAQATFEEACFDGLDNILQPIIHMRQERDLRPRQRTDFPPSAIPSDLSLLPSPLQRPRRPSIPSHSSDHSSSSTPRAPVGSFHNTIVVDDDDSDNDNARPLDNTRCSRCH